MSASTFAMLITCFDTPQQNEGCMPIMNVIILLSSMILSRDVQYDLMSSVTVHVRWMAARNSCIDL